MAKNPTPRLKEALALRRQGRLDQAEQVLRKLLAAEPGNAEALCQLAQLKSDIGAFSEAHYFASAALSEQSDLVPAHVLMGRIYTETGSTEAALASYQRAAELDPKPAEALFGCGVALQRLGRLEDALGSFRASIEALPAQAETWCAQGNVLFMLKRFDAALISFDEAVRHMPAVALLHFNRANTLVELGRSPDALKAYDRALELVPDNPDMRNNRGNTRMESGDSEGAAADFRFMITRWPGDARGHNGLGFALQELGDGDAAIASYERAISLAPDLADAHHNLALVRLSRREFAAAWPSYEKRRVQGSYHDSMRKDPQSMAIFERLQSWTGPGSSTAPVGVWCEQGIGDQILFSTLLPELAAAGQPFVYEVDHRLLPAYQRAFPDIHFVPLADPPAAALANAGSAVFAGSLPGFFRQSVESFAMQPRQVLRAAPERVAHYREQLGPGFKVALSWRSVRAGRMGKVKSANLADFSPLLSVPDVRFVDVQYGDTASERAQLNPGLQPVHFDDVDYYQNLEEVLAIIEACDLLITTSNANAHFAGALGKPAWLLYPGEHPPFHYWAHGGDHRCLWYPSVEIISAPQLLQWSQLAALAAERLHQRSR
jgi:tetratricopeptide (TPR) repeat protein